MPVTRRARWIRHWKLVTLFVVVLAAVVVAFGSNRVSALTSSERSADGTSGQGVDIPGRVDLFDATVIHKLSIAYDQAAFNRMVAAYRNGGRKEYIPVTLTIDGLRVTQVGLRLKGNSTLRGLGGGLRGGAGGFGGGPSGSVSTAEPERLPWLISFDEFVDGRSYQGFETIAVRAGTTGSRAGETGLNEAVALRLVDRAGQPSERFSFGTLAVNGTPAALRLLVEDPDTPFAESRFEHDGVLYKALSTGSFSYRGDDPLSYETAFKQVTRRKRQDLGPLIDLLRWTQNATDAQFAAGLAQRVDVKSFAAYVALHKILGNFDDMAGPGQNYYLWYDLETKRFTPVTWDLNLALSGMGGFGGGQRNAAPPDGVDNGGQGGFQFGPIDQGGQVGKADQGRQAPPGDPANPRGQGNGGPRGGNLLKERFLAAPRYARLAEETEAKLRAALLGDSARGELESLRDVVAKSGAVTEPTLTAEVESLSAALAAGNP